MSTGNVTPTTPTTNPSASASRETRTVAVSGSVRMSDDVLILVTAGIVLSLLGAATPLAPPPNTDPFAPLRGGGESGPSQGYEFDALNISGGACTVSGNGANIELDGAAGAANVAIADGARIKFAWSATAAKWIGNSFGVGGGAVVALAGDAVGPSNNNRLQQIRGDAVNAIAALVSGATVKQTQGGTIPAPSVEHPWIEQPRDPAYAPFGGLLSATFFNGTADYVFEQGYNVDAAIGTLPNIRTSIETDYNDGAQHSIEMHFCQWSIPANWGGYGGAGGSARPLSVNCFASGMSNVAINVNKTGYFVVTDLALAQEYIRAQDGNALKLRSNGSVTVSIQNFSDANRHAIQYNNAAGTIKAITGYYPAGVLLPQEMLLLASAGAAVDVVVYTNAIESVWDGTTGSFQLFTSVGAKDFGAGAGVLGISKATTAPTTNPAGHITYADPVSGASKIRDALGAVSNVSGGFFTQAMANAPQTISAANSASKYYRTTGANTAVRALTISLPANIGTMVVVRNDCTAFGITVQFSSGAATGTILPGTSALICGDGANAFIMMTGT